jgi:hypothetical protein
MARICDKNYIFISEKIVSNVEYVLICCCHSSNLCFEFWNYVTQKTEKAEMDGINVPQIFFDQLGRHVKILYVMGIKSGTYKF